MRQDVQAEKSTNVTVSTLVWAVLALGTAASAYVFLDMVAGDDRIVVINETAPATLAPANTNIARTPSDNTGADWQFGKALQLLRDEVAEAKIHNADLRRRMAELEDLIGPITTSIPGDALFATAPTETSALGVSVAAKKNVREIPLVAKRPVVEGAAPVVITIPEAVGRPDDAPDETAAISIDTRTQSVEIDHGIADSSTPNDTGSAAVATVTYSAADQPDPAVITSTDFAIALATTETPSSSRALWMEMQNLYPDLLGGLSPRVAISETDSGPLRLRLIAGPIRNAAMAAAICAQLQIVGRSCESTVFDGQTLAMR